MKITTDIIWYMQDRQIGDTSIVDAPADDPVMLQAAQDGFADFIDGRWYARGVIQGGERRVCRHSEGDVSVIIGTEEMRARALGELSAH